MRVEPVNMSQKSPITVNIYYPVILGFHDFVT